MAVAMGRDSALCCSGGVDACIRRWRLPDLDMDPYDGYGGFPAALPGEGHFFGVGGCSPFRVTFSARPQTPGC